MIVCSKCGYQNPIQKYCGQCGNQLLTEDAIVIQNPTPQPERKKSNVLRWIVGFIVFILIWFLGAALLSIVADYNGIDDRFSGLIAFVVGFLVMMYLGFSGKESDNEEHLE